MAIGISKKLNHARYFSMSAVYLSIFKAYPILVGFSMGLLKKEHYHGF